MGSDIHMNAQLPTLNPEKVSGHAVQLSRGWGRIRLPLTLTLSPKGRGGRKLAARWIRPPLFGASQKRRCNRQGRGVVGSRCARLAPLSPLSYTLRASARRDAFLVPPPHLEMRNEYPFYLSEPEYFTRTRWRIWSSEERVAGEQARTEIPLTSILCRIRQRRLVRLGSPQGERRGFDVDKATTGRGAHQTCLFTKRTHRFFGIFSMQMALNTLVAAAISERNRWVRFGKRTHREGVLRGYLRI